MAGSTASALPAAAHVVGNAFVNQYYNVLHQSPQVVHRFYTDASRLTRAEAGPDGLVDTVVSQSEIHEKVMSLDYGDFKAEIVTVDSQDSLNGGVLVMVTGTLSNQLSGKRNFVQSFFLAPQEKGYFVLNDIFRYLHEELEPELNKQSSIRVNGVPEPQGNALSESEPTLPAEHEGREISAQEVEPTVEEIFESLEHVAVAETDDGGGDVPRMETTPVIDEPSSPLAALTVSSLEEISEEAPKKSYASIVSYASILRTKENAGSLVPTTTYNTSIAKAVASGIERPALHQLTHPVASTGQDSLEEGPVIENDVDGKSVFVKNLPMSISSSYLEEEFGKYGAVKPGGVNVKSQKQGVCYAFVEFEEIASAQTAIESSPISVGGRQVYIEEKRPMTPRPGGRVGRLSGTGRGDRIFRSDGLRGRPPSAGRGPGVRASGQDIANRGRGTGAPPVRTGSGYIGGGSSNGSYIGSAGIAASAVDHNRRDGQGGNGNRAPRRGSNQISRSGAVLQGSPPVAAV